MNTLKIGLAALLSATMVAQVEAADLIVFHDWASPSEIAALQVLRTQLEAGGDVWHDVSVPHDTGSTISLTNLVAGGNPPDVFHEAKVGIYRDLREQGKLMTLDDFYAKNGVFEKMPASVQQAVMLDGVKAKVPNGIHIDGVACYNRAVAADAGVDPTAWKSMDEFYADFDKVKAKGYIPLAIGADRFQLGYLFHALIAATSGGAIYERIYGGEPDRAAIDTPEMRAAFDALRAMQQHSDEGSPNRKWNDTTNLVIGGKALMQIHGDWMTGEFRSAGKVQGVDYDCMNIPGTKGLAVTTNVWGVLNSGNPDKMAAAIRFATIDLDPKVQHDFSLAKGSIPIRLDVDREGLTPWMLKVLDMLQDPTFQHANPAATVDSDWLGAIWDVAGNFWTDPEMSNDEAIEQLQASYDSIF